LSSVLDENYRRQLLAVALAQDGVGADVSEEDVQQVAVQQNSSAFGTFIELFSVCLSCGFTALFLEKCDSTRRAGNSTMIEYH